MRRGYCREHSTKSVGRITQVSEGSGVVLSGDLKKGVYAGAQKTAAGRHTGSAHDGESHFSHDEK